MASHEEISALGGARSRSRSASDALLSWQSTSREDVEVAAGPLLHSPVVQRLRHVSFLGALGPEHARAAGAPGDTTRFDHSASVAALALRAVRLMGLSRRAERLATAWGLLHDCATWALSHTSEAAFSGRLETSAAALRRNMILGAPALPERFSARAALAQMDLEPESVLPLFQKDARPRDAETYKIWCLVRSPITPDTLDGMWRAAAAYQLDFESPLAIIDALRPDASEPTIARRQIGRVEDFWRAKARIYREWINTPEAIERETTWTVAIHRVTAKITLAESLDLKDQELLALARPCALEARRQQTSRCVGGGARYKPPQVYYLCRSERPSARCESVPVTDLGRYLSRKPASEERGRRN